MVLRLGVESRVRGGFVREPLQTEASLGGAPQRAAGVFQVDAEASASSASQQTTGGGLFSVASIFNLLAGARGSATQEQQASLQQPPERGGGASGEGEDFEDEPPILEGEDLRLRLTLS